MSYMNDKRYQLHHGDCLEFLRTLPAGSVDAVVTDPPYGMSFQSSRKTDKADRFDKIANDDAPYIWWLADAARVLKDGGCLLCFCRWDSAEAFRLAIGWAGLRVASQLIWDRGVHGMGDLRGTPGPRHDTIWFAVKGKYQLPGKRPVSVLAHRRLMADDLDHPNEKPVALMDDLVVSYTPSDATVVDPFLGSGTTGEACVKTGRRFIGCEIDKGYFDIAERRIRKAYDAASNNVVES